MPTEDYSETSILKKYLKEIRKTPLLTREEEISLGKRSLKGDKKAQRKLVTHNLRFVAYVAKRFQGRGFSLLDLIEIGNIGLIEASSRYDHRKGVRFVNYACRWIKNSILSSILRQGDIHIPKYLGAYLNSIEGRLNELSLEGISEDEAILKISSERREDPEKLKQLFQKRKAAISFEDSFSKGNEALGLNYVEWGYSALEEQALIGNLRDDFEKVFRILHPRNRDILMERFGLKNGIEYGCIELGRRHNLTRERIRQIETGALKKVRANSGNLRSYLE